MRETIPQPEIEVDSIRVKLSRIVLAMRPFPSGRKNPADDTISTRLAWQCRTMARRAGVCLRRNGAMLRAARWEEIRIYAAAERPRDAGAAPRDTPWGRRTAVSRVTIRHL
ncbi:hypothetical protein [Actinomadura sp. WMMA1423]|uniref:hypothetical protein n=1 Tax=Actinomadura sp. WMMA1423 TaxID=2591108 RepID=UPI00114692A2|nr:hypothetical protein [Actinomadura sp. WMMA1423]